MNLDKIRSKLQSRKSCPLDISNNFSVFLPLIYVGKELHILFEVRAKHLKTQPGEISFPGGLVEKGESFKKACIRETQEELNISKEDIKIIGELDYINSPYNFMLYVYCGILEGINREEIKPNHDEVDHIFTVPINFFLVNNPIVHNVGIKIITPDDFPYHLIQNGEKYNWRKGNYPVYFYVYNDYIIWGITARIIKNFIDILNNL